MTMSVIVVLSMTLTLLTLPLNKVPTVSLPSR